MKGIQDYYVRNIEGEWRIGGIGLYENELVFASPEDDGFVFMDIDTLKARGLYSHAKSNLGTQGIVADGDDLWLLPLNGMTLTRWNPKTEEVREYDRLPEGFQSVQWPYETVCEKRPFGMIAISRESGKENIVLSPYWGNMYVTLDRETGRMEEWKPPIRPDMKTRGKNGYFVAGGMGGFCVSYPQTEKADRRLWYAPERRLYDVNIDTGAYNEVEIHFDYDELEAHEPGFMEEAPWMQYCLLESAFNSLQDLLDGNITGNSFDRERQIRSYEKVNANLDGTCGREVHRYIRERL